MSMWADYRAELDPVQKFVEYEWGFFAYSLHAEVLCFDEAYVVPDQRRKGYLRQILAEGQRIAREAGKKQCIACVTLENVNSVDALKSHLAIGGVPYLADGNKIWLRWGIE